MSTVPRMFLERAAQSAERRAFTAFDGGAWRDYTWADYERQARHVGLGLVELGLRRGETVAILGGTRREWVVCDVGAMGAGGVTVGLYPTLAPEGVGSMRYVLEHSEARFLFVESLALLRERIAPIFDKLPRVERIILWEDGALGRALDPRVLPLDEVMNRGASRDARDPAEWRKLCEAAQPDDLAILIYTSGTTGQPKGAMLSHGNLVTVSDDIAAISPQQGPDQCTVSFLPMAHAAERVVGHLGRVRQGYATTFARSLETLLDDLGRARPTLFGAVPRVFEKIYSRVTGQLAATPGLKGKLARAAFKAGVQAWRLRQRGERVPLTTRWLENVFQKRIGAMVRARMGGRCAHLIVGAAPTAVEILEFLAACGLPVFECYGMTETSALLTANQIGQVRYGTVGRALPRAQLRIADDGEVQVRAPYVFKGYFKEEQATRDSFSEDGWFKTGDIGSIDGDGYLRITDRKKNILITAGGKNITPSNIENEVKNHPLISFCHLHADKRPYPVALICVDAAERQKLADQSDPAVRALVQTAIDRANAKFGQFERIRKFAILPGEFSIEGGELTPTMKVKRREVDRKYAATLEALYAE